MKEIEEAERKEKEEHERLIREKEAELQKKKGEVKDVLNKGVGDLMQETEMKLQLEKIRKANEEALKKKKEKRAAAGRYAYVSTAMFGGAFK